MQGKNNAHLIFFGGTGFAGSESGRSAASSIVFARIRKVLSKMMLLMKDDLAFHRQSIKKLSLYLRTVLKQASPVFLFGNRYPRPVSFPSGHSAQKRQVHKNVS